MKRISEIKPSNFFLLAALCWFVVYSLVMPPFQSPDEYNHFYRAFRISQGDFLPHHEDKRLGGNVPSSFEEMITPFHFSNADKKSKLTSADILRSFTITVKDSITEFKDFNNTSIYSVVSYFPQSFAIFVCYQLDLSVGAMFYSARISGFLLWVLVIFYAIRIIPVGRWLFVLLSLLPTQLYLVNSVSADIVTNSLSFLLLALILREVFGNGLITTRALLIIGFVACLLAFAKVIYVWIILLLLLIPPHRFRSGLYRFGSIALITFVAALLASLWSDVVMKNYLFYDQYNPDFRDQATLKEGANYQAQKQFILNDPLNFFTVMVNTLADPWFTLLCYVGYFGMYLDFHIPDSLCVVAYIAIIFVALFEINEFRFRPRQRWLLLLVFLVLLCFILLAQYLSWTEVGAKSINGVQGRYLIPVFPVLMLALTGLGTKVKIVPFFVFLMICLLNTVACNIIYNRYFAEDSKSKIEFLSDSEKIENNKLGTSEKDIFLANTGEISNAEHLSGTHSVALWNDSAETFVYRFKGLKAGDWLKIEAWHKGEGGRILVYGKDEQQEYIYEESGLRYSGPGPWQLMRMRLVMDRNAENADFVVKVTNTPGGKVYFDDFHFILKRY